MSEPQRYTQLHVAVLSDGSIRLGSCLHCVTTRQRPPFSQRALYHPKGQIDLDQQELLGEHYRLIGELATYGIRRYLRPQRHDATCRGIVPEDRSLAKLPGT
jgi:hypothetical protein